MGLGVGVTLRFRTFVSPAPINNSGAAFLTQVIALPEPVQSVLRERRVVRYRIVEIEPAEPSVGEVQPHLFASFLSERMP